jgi:2-dehydropantoate 2-reductase
MRIAVFGAGGVGGYFGGRLAKAGEDAVFIARGAHLRALQTSGLRVDDTLGDFVLPHVNATDDPAQVGAVDAVLLAVKGWQTAEAVQALRPLVGPETFVVPLLNGVEAADELSAAFGARHVVGGLCGVYGSLVGPGHIRNTAPIAFVTIGELDNTPSERVERLRQAFERAGVTISVAPNILVALWEKLLFVEPFGSVGAVTRAPADVMRALPETRALLEQAMREIQTVAGGRGVVVEESAIARAFMMIDGSPPGSTTSMQRDIVAGRPSELTSQTGAVVRLGRAAGVETPLHTFLYASLLPQEQRARGAIEFPA